MIVSGRNHYQTVGPFDGPLKGIDRVQSSLVGPRLRYTAAIPESRNRHRDARRKPPGKSLEIPRCWRNRAAGSPKSPIDRIRVRHLAKKVRRAMSSEKAYPCRINMRNAHCDTINWDDLRAFLVVARLGSFKAAGEGLGTPTQRSRAESPILSSDRRQAVARHSKGMRLTHRGRQFALSQRHGDGRKRNRATPVWRQSRHDRNGADRSHGGLATYWLMPQLIAFTRAYPAVRIEIATVNSWATSKRKRPTSL